MKCEFCGRSSSLEFGMVMRCHWCDRLALAVPSNPEQAKVGFSKYMLWLMLGMLFVDGCLLLHSLVVRKCAS